MFGGVGVVGGIGIGIGSVSGGSDDDPINDVAGGINALFGLSGSIDAGFNIDLTPLLGLAFLGGGGGSNGTSPLGPSSSPTPIGGSDPNGSITPVQFPGYNSCGPGGNGSLLNQETPIPAAKRMTTVMSSTACQRKTCTRPVRVPPLRNGIATADCAPVSMGFTERQALTTLSCSPASWCTFNAAKRAQDRMAGLRFRDSWRGSKRSGIPLCHSGFRVPIAVPPHSNSRHFGSVAGILLRP
jgi:hypothetical protein